MAKFAGVNYRRKGKVLKVEIVDEAYQTIYDTKFNLNNESSVYRFLQVLEQFGDLSVVEIIKKFKNSGEFF